MKLFLCLAAFLSAASARPEPPVGYNYPSPSISSFGNSLGSSISLSNQHSQSSLGSLIAQGGEGISPSSNLGFSSGSGFSGFSTGSGFSAGSGFPSTGFSSGGYPSGQSLVHKHVYVHVAPEEHEEHRPQRPIVVGAPQKHYKIIFIKAPAPPKQVAPIIPLQPQNEEKTLVYVLVKKPEEAPEINIPAQIPTQPTKPEVYFIKYNTKKEQSSGGHSFEGGQSLGGLSAGQSLGGLSTGQSLGGLSSGQSLGGSSLGLNGNEQNFGQSLNINGIEQNLSGSSIGHSLEGSSIGQSLGGPSIGHSLGGPSIGQSLGGPSIGQSLDGQLGGHSEGASSSAGVSSKYGPPGYHK